MDKPSYLSFDKAAYARRPEEKYAHVRSRMRGLRAGVDYAVPGRSIGREPRTSAAHAQPERDHLDRPARVGVPVETLVCLVEPL